MTEQVLDVRRSVRLLRRFWRTVALFVLAGLVVAGGLYVNGAKSYRATSLVLLPTSSTGAGTGSPTGHDIATDARIATSAAVVVPAGHQVDPSLSPSALEARVSASAEASGILAVTATGPSARQAEALANAVADEMVTFVTTSGSKASAAVMTTLHGEQAALRGQLTDVKKQLTATQKRLTAEGPSSVAGKQDSATVTRLSAQEATLTQRLEGVTNQITQAELGQGTATPGADVIQRAQRASGPSLGFLALMLVAGAAAGLVVGSLVVLARHRHDPKLWTRDALAEALGSPVVLALDAPARRSAGEWAALLERYHPGSSEQWDIRRALRALRTGDGRGGDGKVSRLDILVFAEDGAGLAQAVQVVLAVAASGMETAFSLVADEGRAATLQAACARWHNGERGEGPRLELRDRVPSTANDDPADLTVTIQVVDRHQPLLRATQGAGPVTVVSVAAGFATAEELARLALVAEDNGSPVKGIFVANPGPEEARSPGRRPRPARMVPVAAGATGRFATAGGQTVGLGSRLGTEPTPGEKDA